VKEWGGLIKCNRGGKFNKSTIYIYIYANTYIYTYIYANTYIYTHIYIYANSDQILAPHPRQGPNTC
jgi:hypothetical protein